MKDFFCTLLCIAAATFGAVFFEPNFAQSMGLTLILTSLILAMRMS